ncbi:Secreted repeat of unknown function [Carnobacterium iners]|uniref:Lipoprotein n=1 Tax=Carnobacterium iners TaxID=1073423 RepID=A0A1X7MX90_9LACT|nr:hypothetical protein [Carnobacterium iners]SEK18114.1 Secreted repeat of unknown function [Carnobacterium iners]SMH29480.1 Secreted repeat of unknown function [Carnobacterium iners]
MKRIFSTLFIASLVLVAGCNTNDDTAVMEDTSYLDTEEMASVESDTEKMTSVEIMGSLQLLKNGEVGEYLADADGMTLYYFKNDEPGKSNATGDVLENWPAFIAEDFEVPEGFDENDFDTIKREDTGDMQVTYRDYPLYYFINDKAKGDVNGEGVNDVWYIINTDTTFEGNE